MRAQKAANSELLHFYLLLFQFKCVHMMEDSPILKSLPGDKGIFPDLRVYFICKLSSGKAGIFIAGSLTMISVSYTHHNKQISTVPIVNAYIMSLQTVGKKPKNTRHTWSLDNIADLWLA